MENRLKSYIGSRPKVKRIIHSLMMHPVKMRPRLWLRILSFLYIKRGQGSVIYRNSRLDITPFNRFEIGKRSVVESYCVINNAVGDLYIGDDTRIGIGSVLIGPVTIGRKVMIAQNVTISGLNHNYADTNLPIADQGVSVGIIEISDDVWIGANCVITKGVRIGKHVVIAASSVVTGDIPDNCVVGGIPAKIIKQYLTNEGCWKRIQW
jgi:acetyltransferase-like isoleucine patch superfamily enzyme